MDRLQGSCRLLFNALRPSDQLHPAVRRIRLLALTQLLVLSVVQLAPAQGQFKYRIDRSQGASKIESPEFNRSAPNTNGKHDLWFGRPRSESTRTHASRPNGAAEQNIRVPEGGGAVLDIPWKKPAVAGTGPTRSEMRELSPESIVVEDARIRVDDDGSYLIDVYARVVGPAPQEFVTVAGLTQSGDGFARSGDDAVGPFMAWKKVERRDSQHFLMSFSLPQHYSMRRFNHYLVKFYDANGFTEAQLPQD